jgi:type IV pilus assembly protein PilX
MAESDAILLPQLPYATGCHEILMNNLRIARLRSLQVRPNTVELSRSLSGVNRSLSGVEADNGLRLRSTNDRSDSKPALLQGSAASQSGVVLVISLIMLLLLTVIGSTAMQTTSLEEKMAGNLRDKDLAFQAAESALRAAENNLLTYLNSLPLTVPLTPNATFTGGFYPSNPTISLADSAISAGSFWTANPVAPSTVTTLGNGINAHPPVYIIQKLPAFCLSPCAIPPVTLTPYKITVRATGASTNTVVILQSIYTLL